MRKELLKRSVAIAAAISMIFSNTASAGVWQQKAGNWFVKDEKSGKNLTGWYQDEKKDWYYLEPSTEGEFNGALRAGWLPAGKDWYFLNPIHDGSFGRMFGNTWLWVDGYCYYFDASGKMLAGTKTPDGYTVNGNGQWTVNGVVQYVPGKGIITKKANSNSGSSGSGSSSGSHSGNHGGSGSNGANNGGTNSGGNTGSDTENQQVTLTVKYMDADTKEILDTRVLTGKTGESVNIEHLELGGYTILDNQPISAVFAAKDSEVYVLYRKVLLSGEIIIRYVNRENNQVIAANTVSGRIDDTYIVHVPVIDGYKAVTEEDQIVTFRTVQQTATVEYRPIRENEEPDQKIIPSSCLKVAKGDSEENKEILSQMYRGIFDFQNHKDGTIDLAVDKNNPILEYIEDGRFTTNDVVSLDPTDEFPTGLTFIYQSHDDNYSGEYQSEYDAEEYEVIHAWQATAFSMYAPGTEIDVEIPVISENLLASSSEWVADEDNENEVTACAERFATYASDRSGSSEKDILFKVVNGELKKELELASGDAGSIKSELKASFNSGFGAKKLVIKIHIPFLNETDIITKKKYCEFKFEPIIKSTLKVGVKTTAEYGEPIPILEEISQNRQNKIAIKGFAIQGLDFEELGLYPFAAQGYNFVLNSWNFNAKDILANDNNAIDESSLSVYIGAVESLAFKMAGSVEFEDSFEFITSDVVMGIKIEKKGGKYTPENLCEVKAPSFKLTAEGKASVDNLDAGVSIMPMASVAGVIPIGIELQGGLTFSDSEASVKATLEVGGDLKEPKITQKVTGKAALSAYVEITGHIRMACELGDGGNQIELVSKDLSLLERKTWPILKGATGYEDGDTIITVYNEQDEFRLSDNEGNNIEKSVHPTFNEVTGLYTFDCPGYILKQDDKGKDKVYKVTELHINLPRDMEAHEWERISLPDTIKKLKVDQILTKSCQVDLSKAGNLEEISMENLNNQISSIDLSKSSTLKKVYIASEYLSDLKLPTTNFLEDLRIDGRHGDTFHSLTLPYNCSTLKNLELYRTDIKDLNTSGMRGLESLTVMWAPLWKLDVSKMTGLKKLNIQETGITSLDVSANKELAQLSTSATLEKFTGNGKVMPNMLNLTWYEDAQKTKPIARGTVCEKGQTIYSNLYNGEKITDIWRPNGMLSIDTNTKFRPADEYGNAITDWPGYDPTTGTASAYKNSEGYWNVQLPQYVLDENNHGYKVLGIYFESAYWGDVDGSKAPDLEKLYFIRSAGAGEICGKLTLPENLRIFQISGFNALGKEGFECDFSNALKLEEITIGTMTSTNYNFDFSQHMKLKTLYVNASNVHDPSTFSMKLPATNSLEEVQIMRSTDGKGTDEPIQLSGLFELKKLYLRGISSQEELDLSDQKNLEDLQLSHMPIKELDLDMCLKLKRLLVGDLLKLEHLDISNLDGITDKYKFAATSDFSLKTFTGNGFVMPRGSWYLDPEKTQVAYTCRKGETIYSSKYDINVDGAETVSLNVPLVPETASNALRKTDVVSETEE